MSEVEDYDDGPKGDEMEQDSDDAASVGSHSEQDVEEQQHHDSEVGSDVASEPASAPQSPSGSEGGQQSEDEVHISEQEEYEQSDKEDASSDKNEEQSGKEDRESDVDGERDDDEDQELAQDVESDKEDHSDREDEQSSDRDEQQEEKEGEDEDNRDKDSDREGSVPEIHIDSGDDYNDRESINKNSDDDDDRQSNSGSEVERDEGSDAEKGSDQDEANRSQVTDATSDAEENNDAGSEDERNSEISGRESPVEETPRSPTPPPDSDDEDEKETKAESDDDEVPSSPLPFEEKMEISTEEMDRADNEAKSDSESDSDSDESKVGELIADIFGKSDDEEEEFEGFGEEDLAAVKQKKEKRKKAAKALSDSEEEVEIEEKENAEITEEVGETEELPPPAAEIEASEAAPKKVAHAVSDDDSDDDGLRKMREDFVSDFDLMMQKKKEENQRKRKRKDVDIINDSDDLIAEIILQMRQAADEDRELNKQRKAATKKLKILPLVMSQLKKQDLKMAFLDQGVLNVMADWLSPLPDRSLPHFQIREGMIRRLGEFPIIDQSLLKCSGVGRALMYLYKHPKETKENRERCGKLITEWARPIFNLTTNFHSLTKEEREQRDFEHLPRKRKSRMDSGEEEEQEKAGAKKDIEKVMSGEEKSLRPGEKGWIARARVPAPSMRDYVVRPKWNVEIEIGRGPGKKPLNRYERHLRTLMEKKKLKKAQRAVTISIEGRKMAI